MRITCNSSRDALTTVSGCELDLTQVLLFRGGHLLNKLQRVPGLAAVSVFRSYSRRCIMVYAQWKDRSAAEAALSSTEYQACLFSVGPITFATSLCDVVFVDDARPVTDDLNAVVLDPEHDRHVTLIGTFSTAPDRREDLLALLRRDHTFLRRSEGFVSVAFHKAVDREDTDIEVLQFQSARQLRAVSRTPRGAAHLAAVDALAKVSANIYRLNCGFEQSSDVAIHSPNLGDPIASPEADYAS